MENKKETNKMVVWSYESLGDLWSDIFCVFFSQENVLAMYESLSSTIFKYLCQILVLLSGRTNINMTPHILVKIELAILHFQDWVVEISC